MSSMPAYVVELVAEALNTVRKPINGSRIHLVGVAYKRDVNDLRESPALDVIELLVKRGAVLSYSDPFVPELCHGGHAMRSIDLSAALQLAPDCTGDLHRPFGLRLRGDRRERHAGRGYAKRAAPYDAPTSSGCSR